MAYSEMSVPSSGSAAQECGFTSPHEQRVDEKDSVGEVCEQEGRDERLHHVAEPCNLQSRVQDLGI
jgi:hypothetical protein